MEAHQCAALVAEAMAEVTQAVVTWEVADNTNNHILHYTAKVRTRVLALVFLNTTMNLRYIYIGCDRTFSDEFYNIFWYNKSES